VQNFQIGGFSGHFGQKLTGFPRIFAAISKASGVPNGRTDVGLTK
jgi:hypothetical protein